MPGNFSREADGIAELSASVDSERAQSPRKVHGTGISRSIKVYSKDMSEAHICIGVPFGFTDKRGPVRAVCLNTLLGAGVSSRLFQEIREKRGLAYSVYSFTSCYLGYGFVGCIRRVSAKNG